MTSSLAKAKLCRDAAIRRGASPTSQPVQGRQACPKAGPHPTHTLLLPFQRALRPPALTLPLPSSSCPCPRPSLWGPQKAPSRRQAPSSPQGHSLTSPRMRSTSIRSGWMCPFFFGLLLKPCGAENKGPSALPTPHTPTPRSPHGEGAAAVTFISVCSMAFSHICWS